jgi:hypothetical protein
MFLVVSSLLCSERDLNAISSPWVWVLLQASSGACNALPHTAFPPYVTSCFEDSTIEKTKSLTLSHMLALPAQLRKSLCRSCLEKKRSSTKSSGSSSAEGLSSLKPQTICSSRIHLHGVLHFARQKGGHSFSLDVKSHNHTWILDEQENVPLPVKSSEVS